MLSEDVVLTTACLYCPLTESLPAVVCQSFQEAAFVIAWSFCNKAA